MRLGGSTVMLAILLGVVPGLAQDSPGIIPKSTQPAEKARPAHRHLKPKIAAPKIAAPQTVVAKTAALKTEPAGNASLAEMSAGLSASERLKIQSALLWSGDYTGSIGGEDPFISAVKNFQKRAKTKVTGILTPTERANLLAATKSHEDEYGWTIVADPLTGA